MATTTNPARGETFGRYRLLDCLGEGGMAVVYRAVTEGPRGFQREVVLKRIRADLSRDPGFTGMLLAEARLCALLNHPGIVQVHELGEVEGEYFIAMELVDGHDLSSVILRARTQHHPPPVGVAAFLVLQVAEALAYAHTLHGPDGHPLQIVHRDVSPSNVMVTPLGAVKLLDFGVARAILGAGEDRTRTGTLKGKIGYLSPEQAEGLSVDHRSDIFALGICLHELLTLKRLFRGEDDLQTLRLIRESEVPLPSTLRGGNVDPEVEALVMQMLSRDPAARPQSCEDVVERLQPIVHRLASDHGQLKHWLDELAPIPSRHLVEDRTKPGYGNSSVPTVGNRVSRLLRMRTRRQFAGAFLLGLVLAIIAGVTAGRLHRRSASPTRRSVAVLGLKNLSGRADAAWLSTALSEMITTELGSSNAVRAVPGEEVARARVEVGAGDFDHAQPETLQRLRTNLGADLVLDGGYLALGEQLRLDLRLGNQKGETVVALSETGTQNQLFGLVARVGTKLRAKLGDRAPSEGARSSLPQNPEAARLYSEGLEQLRLMDALSARERLSRAAALDPQSPAIHSSLSAAESSLGYEARALEEAKRAFELSQSLPPAERLSIEGRYRLATREHEQAVTAYRSLFALHPDSLEDGLQLVHALSMAARGEDALQTINGLRKLPGGATDPRVDLAEAHAALLASAPERAHKAALAAIEKGNARGAPLLVARGHFLEGRAQWGLAHAKEAIAAYTTADRTFAAAGDMAARAQVLIMLSDLHYAQGNLVEARRTVEDALQLSQKLGDKRGEASALTGLANLVSEEKGGDTEALKIYERVMALCNSVDDKQCVASQLNNMGTLYQQRRQLEPAKKNYGEAVAMLRDAKIYGDTYSVILANLASVLFDLGDLSAARTATEEGLASIRRTGTKGDASWALYYLGRIEMMAYELDPARKHFQEAFELDGQQGKDSERAAAKAAMAEILLEQHKFPEAEAAAREALAVAKAAPSTVNLGFGSEMQVAEVLARILLAEGRLKLKEAAQLVARARAVVPENADPDWVMLLAVTEARLQASMGRPHPALSALSRELSKTDDYLFHKLWIEVTMAEIGGSRVVDGKKLAKEARAHGFELLARHVERVR